MSKFKLSELLKEVVGGRIGTLNISARDLVSKMEDLEDKGVRVDRFDGLSDDGKTYLEFHVHPMRKYDEDTSFSIYDFKFGFDPMGEDHFMEEYPFSIGGRTSALDSAETVLRSGDIGYEISEDTMKENGHVEDFANELVDEDTAMSGAVADELEAGAIGDRVEEETSVKENMYIDNDEFEMEMGRSKKDSLKKEMMIHVDQLIDGNIDMNDFMNVVEDVMAEVNSLKEEDEKSSKSRPHMSSDKFLRHIEKLHKDNQTQMAKEKEVEENDQKRYEDTAAKMLKDRVLKDIPMDIIVDFVKTHGSDIRRMSNSEIKDEFEEFRSVNYDYIDENLKAHFNRFK